jgi:hypothetical protein
MEREPARVHPREHGYGPTEVKTLLSWKAPGRPYKKKGREYFINILLLTLAINVILFLFSQYLAMLVVVTLAFLAYALATVPPRDFHYKITTEGIMVEDYFLLWQELYDFYFKHRDGLDILHVGTKTFYPGELIIVLEGIPVEHVKSVLLPYLPYREYVSPTFVERWGSWLEKNFPLDKTT